MLTFPITMALHPVVMRASNAGHRLEALQAVSKWTRLMLAAVALGTVVAFAMGPRALGWFLGIEAPSRGVVALLLLAAGLWQVAQLTHKPLEVDGRTIAMLGLLGGALFLELAVSLALVSRMGAVGVAVGLVVGATSYLGGVALLAGKVRNYV